ncbi:hypothetical protein BHM03_00017938 [Ensete ventricosum]|nr:hypothetical protein BHM03_00017938 [Ensete ventricosum]
MFQWKKVHWKESYRACIVRHDSGTSTGPASNAAVGAGSPRPSRFIRAKLILARCSGFLLEAPHTLPSGTGQKNYLPL